MSLKFVLSGGQIKHFKLALQSLGKLALLQLVLRCINTAKSAFMSVTFHNTFFDHYEVLNCTVVQAGVLVKNALASFRTQRISRVVGELRSEQNNLQITLTCDSGLTKRYCLDCLDSEILQATVDKDNFPTCVVAEASELSRLLASFHQSLDEITIFANPETATSAAHPHKACQIKSYIDPAKGHSDTSLHTQLMLNTRSIFLSYQHNSDLPSDVTFNLRDFRALLHLCEHMGANIAIRFDQPGVPLVVEPVARGPQDLPYEAELVLATLMESQAGSQQEEPELEAEVARPAPVPHRSHSGAAPTPYTSGVTRGATTANVGYIPGDTPWRTTDGGRGAAQGEPTYTDAAAAGSGRTPGTVMQPPRQPGGRQGTHFDPESAVDHQSGGARDQPIHLRHGATAWRDGTEEPQRAATSHGAATHLDGSMQQRPGTSSWGTSQGTHAARSAGQPGPSHMDVDDEGIDGEDEGYGEGEEAGYDQAGRPQYPPPAEPSNSGRPLGLDPSDWGRPPSRSAWQSGEVEADEDEDEELPATPPEKRMRSAGAGILSSMYLRDNQ